MKDLTQDSLERWTLAAKAMEIPEEYYSQILIRRIEDKTGKKNYPLAVVYNEGRAKRPSQGKGSTDCNLCKAIKEAEGDSKKDLFPEARKQNLVVTPNVFPPTRGATLFISKSEPEIPMYTTRELGYLGKNGEFLGKLISLAGELGLRLYHQTRGAGATITRHEHFHGSTFYKLQEIVGLLGFDFSELKEVSEGVSIMPEFPFSHLVFTENDPEKIVYALNKMNTCLPSPLSDGSIPHTLSQGRNGILITPTKIDVGRDMGSERAPGFFYVPTREEFDSVQYADAMKFMSERFFPKEAGLEKIFQSLA